MYGKLSYIVVNPHRLCEIIRVKELRAQTVAYRIRDIFLAFLIDGSGGFTSLNTRTIHEPGKILYFPNINSVPLCKALQLILRRCRFAFVQ